MPKIELGKKYLFRSHPGSDICDGDVREFSPSGRYANMRYVGWCDVSQMVILEELPADKEDGPVLLPAAEPSKSSGDAAPQTQAPAGSTAADTNATA